jgi:hypothetical protein
MTLIDEYVAASAQAFLQGLYPPTNQNSSGGTLEAVDILANGTISQAPLNGYQYPQLQSVCHSSFVAVADLSSLDRWILRLFGLMESIIAPTTKLPLPSTTPRARASTTKWPMPIFTI